MSHEKDRQVTDFQLLPTFPAPVRTFTALARAAGIEYREDAQGDASEPIASLHGPVSAFKVLPWMERQRVPLRSCHWWLPVGIVGTLKRAGDSMEGVIECTRAISPRTRSKAALRARADAGFTQFMQRALRPTDLD